MKQYVFFLSLAFLLVGCHDKKSQVALQVQDIEKEYQYDQLPDSLRPQIEVEQPVRDLGCFNNTKVRKTVFSFTNTGKAPLILHDVHGHCGCVKTEFSKQPILPNQKGKIVVIYDGKEYEKGKFVKSIAINSNAVSRYYNLQIKGETK